MLKWGLGLIAAGVLCRMAFGLIGHDIAPDGALVEPFALLPLGYAAIASGAVLVLLSFLRQR